MTKRGPGFWIAITVGGLGACCGLPLLGLGFLGVVGSLNDDSASSSPATPASAPTNEPDDFIWKGNGLEYIAENHVAAEGVPVTLVGEWREDHRNLILRLRDGGRYELTSSGGVLMGNSIGDRTAYGSSTAESGSWQLQGSSLILTPQSHELSGSVGLHHLDTEKQKADAPRAWNVVGVTIEYTRHGEQGPRQRPGLHVTGEAPSWYWPTGQMNWTLRSAPWSE